MPVNKFKIFKIRISTGGNFSLDNATQEALSSFLNDPNNVYIGHSSSVLSEDIEEHGQIKSLNRFLAISVVYKDLTESSLDVSKVSSATKKVVVKELEMGKTLRPPTQQTRFDKEFEKLGPPSATKNVELDIIRVLQAAKKKS